MLACIWLTREIQAWKIHEVAAKHIDTLGIRSILHTLHIIRHVCYYTVCSIYVHAQPHLVAIMRLGMTWKIQQVCSLDPSACCTDIVMLSMSVIRCSRVMSRAL